ncbi:exo-beta-N-acetylmuramidase NamZ family protein [Petrotoga sp. DB-2]
MILQGLDIIEKDGFTKLKNKKVGLVINYSFVNKNMEDGIEIMLKNGVDIRKIFTPEHGLHGLADGVEYSDQIHPVYNIPIISLYGKHKKPTQEMLEDIDVLVYDIQDVGLRFYTFIYTLANTMISAQENSKKVIILDRINPLGRIVFGSRIKKEYSTFVGGYELPLRYGLTPGELAKYYKKYLGLDLGLEIIPIEGWKGEPFENTKLKWNIPSPALPTFDCTLAYSGTCLIEGTNVSEGRGTPKPFCFVGSPWVDENILYKFIKEKFPNLILRKRYFIPNSSKYQGELCKGIEFLPEIKDNFTIVTVEIIRHLIQQKGEFEFRKYIDRGSQTQRDHIEDLLGEDKKIFFENDETYLIEWHKNSQEFVDFCEDILLYGGLKLWKV